MIASVGIVFIYAETSGLHDRGVWLEQQSSYSAMLNIAKPAPSIPEFVNLNSQPYLGIPSYSGVAQKRNSGMFNIAE